MFRGYDGHGVVYKFSIRGDSVVCALIIRCWRRLCGSLGGLVPSSPVYTLCHTQRIQHQSCTLTFQMIIIVFPKLYANHCFRCFQFTDVKYNNTGLFSFLNRVMLYKYKSVHVSLKSKKEQILNFL